MTDEQLEQYREWKKAGGAGAEGAGRAAGEESDVERMLIQATEGGDALEVIDHAHLISSHLIWLTPSCCIACDRAASRCIASQMLSTHLIQLHAHPVEWRRGV